MPGHTEGRAMSLVKIIAINVLVFFVTLNVLYWAIPVVGTMSRVAWTEPPPPPPNYSAADAAWVRRHSEEMARKTNVYRSYVGWQTARMTGETINIEGPNFQRRTNNDNTSDAQKVYFFGGSTMWGVGATDATTIPSQFAATTGVHAQNFGEIGWTAHQGLMQLIRLLQAGHRPNLVVFYDGVNDTDHKCRTEVTPDSHERERQFDETLRRSLNPDSFAHFFAPIARVGANVHREFERWRNGWNRQYDCANDPDKAAAIADNLVDDWRLAKHLVELHGGRFIGVLQPVSYFSHTRLEHIKLSAEQRKQYQAVYPRVREKIADVPGLHDFVAVLDIDEYLYFDFCHLSPNGNRYVAHKIAELVAPLALKR
jgi:lysophospholipase L1-like esterase